MNMNYRDRQNYLWPTPTKIRSKHHRFHPFALIVTLLVLCFIGLSIAGIMNYEYGTETSVVFTVKSLDDQASGNNHTYLVFTDVPGTNTPGEVLADKDSIMHGKWNSSNLWANLQDGGTYRATVYGYRNGFLSTYRVLLNATPITVAQATTTYKDEEVKPVSS